MNLRKGSNRTSFCQYPKSSSFFFNWSFLWLSWYSRRWISLLRRIFSNFFRLLFSSISLYWERSFSNVRLKLYVMICFSVDKGKKLNKPFLENGTQFVCRWKILFFTIRFVLDQVVLRTLNYFFLKLRKLFYRSKFFFSMWIDRSRNNFRNGNGRMFFFVSVRIVKIYDDRFWLWNIDYILNLGNR